MYYLGVKVFQKHPTYIQLESDNPKKFKLVLQKFLYENSFHSLDDYFELQKVKYFYIWFGLVFESLAHEVDMHLCMFLFLNVLMCILNLLVYATRQHECTNCCLLWSDVVNYFFGQ